MRRHILFSPNWVLNEQVEAEPTQTDDNIINVLRDHVGGDPVKGDALKTSFEALQNFFDRLDKKVIDAPATETQEIYDTLLKDNRAYFLSKYSAAQETEIKELSAKLKSVDVAKAPAEYADALSRIGKIGNRVMKINRLLSKHIKVNEEETVYLEPTILLQNTLESTNRSLALAFDVIEGGERERIEAIPPTAEGSSALFTMQDVLKLLGLLEPLRVPLANKESAIDRATNRRTRKNWEKVKQKERIINRLINAITFARLPAISEKQVKVNGDYYMLFKRLMKRDEATGLVMMDEALTRYVFQGNQDRLSQFKDRAIETESPLEEDQLNYLLACRSWITSYIRKGSDDLTNREETNYLTKLNNTVLDKTKDIKNYYLARDFNLGNFEGISLDPEVRLPLYTKVKLEVTEEDRVKDSPLKLLGKAIKTGVAALFSTIPDNGNREIAARNAAQNTALLSALSSMVKAGVITVGGKQAGRDYDKLLKKKEDGKDGKPIKEDMLAPASANMVNPETSGDFQVPIKMVEPNMDTMAKAGPGKKTKRKPLDSPKKGQMLNFEDFINQA